MQKNVLDYRIIIEKEQYEDGSDVYVAYCPKLGISDYGDTAEKVLVSIKDGIELAIESLAKAGEDVPVDNIEEQIITSAKVKVPTGVKISLA
ncbi:MAG TPA: type II toxin-antitoxin system HicB family antitoxin [Xanthomonadales bacterium]|nr:type II toxin-antitoxin system HicB family antitoxin [Xanthomonadales bacterium]